MLEEVSLKNDVEAFSFFFFFFLNLGFISVSSCLVLCPKDKLMFLNIRYYLMQFSESH